MLRKIVSALTSAAMVAMFAPAVATPSDAWAAEEVTITKDTIDWKSGTYIAKGAVTLKDRAYLKTNANVTLRLTNNCELHVSSIVIPQDATLTIKADSSGKSMGKLIAESKDGDAAIGSPKGNVDNEGNLIIYGGDITATSTGGGAGIGSGCEAEFGDITIKGGIVKATSSSGGAGIGAGVGGSVKDSASTKGTCGNITINNGMITAKGGNTGSGIGCGGAFSSVGNVTINGGVVNAEGGSNGTDYTGVGIGKSTHGKCGAITIASSVVTATGQKDHKGINGTVSISDNAVVFANGGFSDNNSTKWNGVVLEDNEGAVYGTNVTPTGSFEIGKGKKLRIDSPNSLTINSGKIMTVKGKISGKAINNNGIIRVMQGASMGAGMVNGTNSYAVILHPGNGVDLGETPLRTYGEGLVLPELTRIGYTFGGWYINEDCTGSSITNASPATTVDTNYYAKWTPNQYTISFDSNGGSAVAPITQNYNTSVTTPVNPTRTGYTFAGWFRDGDSKPYEFTTMPAESISLKAKWSINTYAISFDSDGGSAVSSISSHYGDKVAAPAAPTRDGYSFEGWFRDGDKKPYEFTTMPAEDVSLKAKWTAIHYHSAVGVAAKAATCTEPGLTEGSKCSSCSAVLKAQESVPALGHEWGAWHVTKPATLKKAGTEARSCQNAGCAEIQTRELARLASKTVKIKGVSYLCDGKNAVVVGASKKLKKAAIPATVKIDGVKHPVTGIAAGALKGCKGLKSITVGTKKLTKESVKGSLKGSSVEKVVVKVGGAKANKACAKKYKKLFAAKVCGKKGVKVVAWKKAAR